MSKAELIYNAVLDLLKEQNNLMSVTVADIAEKCGIGKGTVYEYFSSKEDIFIHTTMYVSNRIISDIKMIEAETFKELFDAYYELLFELKQKSGALYLTLMLGGSVYDITQTLTDGIFDIISSVQNEMVLYCSKMMKKGIKEGILSQNMDTGDAIFVLSGLSSMIFMNNNNISKKVMFNTDFMTKEKSYECFVRLLN